MTGSTLPERVAQIYYTYGLFCSSYPALAVTLALFVVLLCCYPLLNVPLPGNIPTVVNVPLYQHGVSAEDQYHMGCSRNNKDDDNAYNSEHFQNETQKLPYLWAKEKPLLYVHQIILKTGVSPWSSDLRMWDAYRAPLQEVFRLLETIRNHEDAETKTTLANLCYQVDGVQRRDKGGSEVMPEYACLILSPANLWHQNLQAFSLDTNIISTVYSHQSIQKSKVSVAEMAFGLQLRESGVRRYPLRARPRVLQYAATVFYRALDERFITSLNKKLRAQYPLHQDQECSPAPELTLVYYPGEFNYRELIPLTITFVGLFLYVYFSVRKIEFIKSKFGLAASAVLTVAASLSMSMGICFYFGFSLSLQGKEVFPYLVIILGLENVLVLTKSVTSTDSRLDVKIRLAQGLSKEGWSITKNLLTEITVFTVGFFTFVPFIQEFSIFMIISLVSDYFTQMAFFATVLGIDVRRMEYFQDNSKLHLKDYFQSSGVLDWRCSEDSPRMTKSKSHPRLSGLAAPTDVVAKRGASPKRAGKVPKRIRLVNFWARTRFFQRAFMVWMVVWISMIVYNSGVVEYLAAGVAREERAERRQAPAPPLEARAPAGPPPAPAPPDAPDGGGNHSLVLRHSALQRPWTRLSPYHWSAILGAYNASLSGGHLALLPPLLLSRRVAPDAAAAARPPGPEPAPLRWQALAAALDPVDGLADYDKMDPKGPPHQWGAAAELPLYPTTPMEILLLAILCSISVAVIAYMMVVLYRCICSRNYAEWRASWGEHPEYKTQRQPAVQLVMEAVPLVVAGHQHEVECLAADGERVASSCLQGVLKVWDAHSGDALTKIDRPAYFKMQKELYGKANAKKEPDCDAVEVTNRPDVTPKTNESIFKLRKGLRSHLTGLRFRSSAAAEKEPRPPSVVEATKYEFAKAYRDLYCSDRGDYDARSRAGGAPEPVFGCDGPADSAADSPGDSPGDSDSDGDSGARALADSPVWCMDMSDDLIIAGCADGRLEFWDANTGKLLCTHATRGGGVTHVRALGGARRALCATLGGHVALLRVHAGSGARRVDWKFSSAYRRTHQRTGSAGSLGRGRAAGRMSFSCDSELGDSEASVQCSRVAQCRPHQQPVSELQCEGARVLTGGQDHVLKVFSSADLSPLLTLHGHCGPITSSFVDHAAPTVAGSGSQDGLLCVWDLHTGACLYSMQAHDGAVTSLTYTASYVLSAGADERLCVWDRFQGHLLNNVHVGLSYMSRMLPLTHSLLLMGHRSGLAVYDLSSGDVIRRVLFSQTDGGIFVRQILPLKDAIVCDFANQLRIVRFPLVSRLSDAKNE